MSRSTASYHHGNLGPVLEDAALKLMVHHGHTSMSLREVAREAGVSHNAPYHHFGDRTGLLKRLSERSMAELLASLEAAEAVARPGESPQSRAVRIGAAYVAYAAEHPERFRVIYDPAVCVPGSPSEAMAPLIGGVERVLAEASVALLPADDPSASGAIATAVWGTVHGLAELVVAGHITADDVEPALVALLDPGAAARRRAEDQSG